MAMMTMMVSPSQITPEVQREMNQFSVGWPQRGHFSAAQPRVARQLRHSAMVRSPAVVGARG
jgi:hypothetical protein